MRVVEVMALLLSPTLIFTGVIQVGRLLAAARARRAAALPPPPPDLVRVGIDLRRLRTALRAAEDDPTPTPGRGMRLRTLRTAYVDALGEAARAVAIAPPAHPGDAEVFRVEAGLRHHGIDVTGRTSSHAA